MTVKMPELFIPFLISMACLIMASSALIETIELNNKFVIFILTGYCLLLSVICYRILSNLI